MGLQHLIATLFAVIYPTRLLLLVLPSLLYSSLYNAYLPTARTTAALNRTLHATSEYSLLARQESLTGYISVLENRQDHFRVLRCDHSILGGDWLQPPGGLQHTSKVREPIYAIFTMLEAVRLVEANFPTPRGSPCASSDTHKKALVVGLGIGTASSALVAHGVNTTTLELDPIVRDYAIKYFNLPKTHHTRIEDALTFARNEPKGGCHNSYDYIIHDVFTGGAEPVDLFTFEFFTGLSSRLKSDGVIAINYAGDILLPSARIVVQTIRAVFPSCRIFREDEPPKVTDTDSDFTNMVIFCVKSAQNFTFREPIEADFLGSHARRHYLLPKYEIDIDIFVKNPYRGGGILRENSTAILEKWQELSAIGHWGIMRRVLPPVVWENW